MISANFRSLKNKIFYINNYVKSNKVSIVLGSETWFDSTVNDNFLENFNVFRSDRNSRGGGVLIAIVNCIKAIKLDIYKSELIESIFVKLFINNESYLLGSIYIPPVCQNEKLEEFEKFLFNIERNNNYSGVIIGGDFNLNLLKRNNFVTYFNDIIDSYGYEQLVYTHTYPINNDCYSENSLIDLMLTNCKEIFKNINVTYNIAPTCDHFAVAAKLNLNLFVEKNNVKRVPIFDDRFYQSLNDKLQAYNWEQLLDKNSIDVSFSEILEKILFCYNEVIEYKEITLRDKSYISRDIKKLIIKKRKFYRKYRETGENKYYNKFMKVYYKIGVQLESSYSEKLYKDINQNNSFYNLYKKLREIQSNRYPMLL